MSTRQESPLPVEQSQRLAGSRQRIASFSIVIPAHNEAEVVAACLQEARGTLEKGLPPTTDLEIVLVDDGSTDGTFAEASRLAQADPRVRVVQLDRNYGKGHALQVGALSTRGEVVAFLDADLDLHPRQLLTLLQIMQQGSADIVIGSKLHPRSVLRYPLHRRALSWAYYALVRLLFGLPVRDTQTGIKLFRRQVLTNVLPRLLVKRFAYDLELLVVAHLCGYTIAEAPITLSYGRQYGRIHMRDVWRILLDTAAIFYRRYLLRYYHRPGDR